MDSPFIELSSETLFEFELLFDSDAREWIDSTLIESDSEALLLIY